MGKRSEARRRAGWARVFGPLGLVVLLTAPGSAAGWQDAGDAPVSAGEELQVRVWLGRGESPVLERGERARLYYRASHDVYVAIFHVNTDGIVRLLHPRAPGQDHYVRGRRDYRLLFPRSSYWYVDDDPGVGYFFAVASPRPLDFSAFRYSHQAGGWDLTPVGRRVYEDPYAAMDDYVAHLIPRWREAVYALDFVEYHVGRRHEYPRFLCYDCHGFRPYRSWNPYHYACRSFRLVISTDPYFYPSYRYRGTRVVYTRPLAPERGRYSFQERADGEPWTPLYRDRPDTGAPGVEGRARRRPPQVGEADSRARSPVRGGDGPPPRRPEVGPDAGTEAQGTAGARERDREPGGRDGPGIEIGPRQDEGAGGESSRPFLRRRPDRDRRPSDPASPTEGNPRTPVEVRPDPADRSRERPRPVPSEGSPSVRSRPTPPERAPEARPRPSRPERNPSARPRPSRPDPSPTIRRRPPPADRTPSARPGGRGDRSPSPPSAGSRPGDGGNGAAGDRSRRRPPPRG